LHGIGTVYEKAKQWDSAEAAYHQALRIRIESKDKAGQALILGQLGSLYRLQLRLEESAKLFRQAAAISEELVDPPSQARSLNNLATVLLELESLAAAREAATRALKLSESLGHVAAPWKTWHILQKLEALAGDLGEAVKARAQAMKLYATYRRAGGEPTSTSARLVVTVGQVLRSQTGTEALGLIPPPKQFEEIVLPVRDALLAIIGGSRDPALAQDIRLNYDTAVEFSLLLESLVGSEDQEASSARPSSS